MCLCCYCFFTHSFGRPAEYSTHDSHVRIYIQSLYLCSIGSHTLLQHFLYAAMLLLIRAYSLIHSLTQSCTQFFFKILIFTIKFSVCTCVVCTLHNRHSEYNCRQFQLNRKITFSMCAFFHAVCSDYFHTESGFMVFVSKKTKNLMSYKS